MTHPDHLAADGPLDAPDHEELREWCDALDGLLQAWGLRRVGAL